MESQVEKETIRISIIGSRNNFLKRQLMFRQAKGFTLIELTVVIILLGIIMTLTVPRFHTAILTDDLKATTRKMVGIIKGLRDEAIREQRVYFLHFDLESNRFWIDSTGMSEEERAREAEKASTLPETVRVLDVWLGSKGKKMTGETAIRFSKKGYVQPSAIHLGAEDGREFTLVLNPFLGRVTIYDRYIEFEAT
jgi:prepilin-type N-terminal cleavage/methylation domain-containing protein